MRHTLMVDNSPQAFGFHVDNGVPIKSFYNDPLDTELIKLMKVLEEVLRADDVRDVLAEKFGMWETLSQIKV